MWIVYVTWTYPVRFYGEENYSNYVYQVNMEKVTYDQATAQHWETYYKNMEDVECVHIEEVY